MYRSFHTGFLPITLLYPQVLDSITTKPYCLVYFHTGCTGRRRDLEFLQRLLNNCPSRYQSNLTNVYSVHASTIHKVGVCHTRSENLEWGLVHHGDARVMLW